MLSDSMSKQWKSLTDSRNFDKDQTLVRRKPGRPPKQHPPGTINGIIAQCAVCHDKATGLHYAVMTCEGCKGFFKRSIQAEKIYKCRNAGSCVINKESRNACQACRMKRCFDMGMKDNLVRDDRTPGNRKKKYTEVIHLGLHPLSDNSNNAPEYVTQKPIKFIKQEGTCIQNIRDLSLDVYPELNKKRYESYTSEYCGDLSSFNFGNMSSSTNALNHEIMCTDLSPNQDFDDWEFSRIASEMTTDISCNEVMQHIPPAYEQPFNHMDNSIPIYINCSEDQELPLKKCRQNPKCLMHLLTRLMKAKPVEAAFCKYFDRYPTSEQFLDCLADEIHLIIKFAKKTPGFCDLSMGRKLSIIQKHALSILFIRIIYRSFSCQMNYVQFASNICLNYNDFENIDILSRKFGQSLIDLISSLKSLNLDIYELCLIQYAVIEDEDWAYLDPEIRYYPILDGFYRPTSNISQKYLKLYTTNKYPDQPHRWIFIMLSLTQVQEIVKLFTAQVIDLVNAHRMAISNDILKEIMAI